MIKRCNHKFTVHPFTFRRYPLLLLILSVVLLFIICLPFATVYAISDTNAYEESNAITKTNKSVNSDSSEGLFCVEGGQGISSSVFVDNDHLIPDDPTVGEGESPSKIIVPELQDKTGVPEIYDDGIFRYYLVDGAYYEVAGIYKSCFDKIEIPSELFGVPVKGIQSYAFNQYKYLVSVVIPDSIEYIGDYAFHNCPNLALVTLPNNEIQIGEGVFQISE